MESDQYPPDHDALTTCTWCGAPLGQNVMPPQSAKLFCSRSCEIEGNLWIFQELSISPIPHTPQQNMDPRDL